MKEEKVSIDHNALLKIIENTSFDNPIKAVDLEIALGYTEKKSGKNRIIRIAITELIQKKHLIGANNSGYFKIRSLVELNSYIHDLDSHIQGTKNKKRWIKQAWNKAHPNKHILKIIKDKT